MSENASPRRGAAEADSHKPDNAETTLRQLRSGGDRLRRPAQLRSQFTDAGMGSYVSGTPRRYAGRVTSVPARRLSLAYSFTVSSTGASRIATSRRRQAMGLVVRMTLAVRRP